jgi:hypothetical protein
MADRAGERRPVCEFDKGFASILGVFINSECLDCLAGDLGIFDIILAHIRLLRSLNAIRVALIRGFVKWFTTLER